MAARERKKMQRPREFTILGETLGEPIEEELVAEKQAIRFVGVRTADVLKLECDDGRDVSGAFVKLSPRLRRSERAAYDAAGAVAALKGRGALVVVSAPVMIPDDVAAPVEHSSTRSDPRDELRASFGDRLDDVSTAALERCLQLMDMMRF